MIFLITQYLSRMKISARTSRLAVLDLQVSQVPIKKVYFNIIRTICLWDLLFNGLQIFEKNVFVLSFLLRRSTVLVNLKSFYRIIGILHSVSITFFLNLVDGTTCLPISDEQLCYPLVIKTSLILLITHYPMYPPNIGSQIYQYHKQIERLQIYVTTVIKEHNSRGKTNTISTSLVHATKRILRPFFVYCLLSNDSYYNCNNNIQ